MDTITLKFQNESGEIYTKVLKHKYISCGFHREYNRYVYLLNQRVKVLQDRLVEEKADNAKMLFEFNEFSTIEAIKMCQFIAETIDLTTDEYEQFTSEPISEFWDVQDRESVVAFNDNFRARFGLTTTRGVSDSQNGENS